MDNSAHVSLILSEKSSEAVKAFRNLENVKIERYEDINAYKIFLGGVILFDSDIFSKKTTEKTAAKPKTKPKTTKKVIAKFKK